MFLLPLQVMRAQDDYQYRLEIGAGVGLVAYEGDLNGNILAHQQPMAAIVGRYNFDPYKDLRFNLGLGKLKGSNDKVKTDYPDLDGKSLLLQQYPGGYEPRLRVQLLALWHRQGLQRSQEAGAFHLRRSGSHLCERRTEECIYRQRAFGHRGEIQDKRTDERRRRLEHPFLAER